MAAKQQSRYVPHSNLDVSLYAMKLWAFGVWGQDCDLVASKDRARPISKHTSVQIFLIIERLNMTLTADGKRQRQLLIFRSFLLIRK